MRITINRHTFVLPARFVQARQADFRFANASLYAFAGIGRAGISAGTTAKLHFGGRQLGAFRQTGGCKGEAQSTTNWDIMSRTVAGQGRRAWLAAILLGTRKLALEAMTGVALEIEVGLVLNEPVMHPTGLEVKTVGRTTLLETARCALADIQATLLIESGNLDPGSDWH